MKDSMNNKAYYNSTIMGNFIEGNVNESGDTVMKAMQHVCNEQRYKGEYLIESTELQSIRGGQ